MAVARTASIVWWVGLVFGGTGALSADHVLVRNGAAMSRVLLAPDPNTPGETGSESVV